MEIAVFVWVVLVSIIVIQVSAIIYYVRKAEHIEYNKAYSQETIEKTRTFVEAIKTKKIKKHIITNSAPIYDSRKTLMQYREFLSSEMMHDLSMLNEERYNG